MKPSDNQAVLTYLEYHLLQFVEDTEKHISDRDVVADMYDRAYGILADFEQTMAMQTALESKPLTTNKKQ